MKLRLLVLGLFLVAFCRVNVHAELRLPAVLSDNMVLQRDRSVPIWGWAEPGETIVVTLAEQTKSTTTDTQGKWKVDLDSMPAGGPWTMVVRGAGSRLEIKNILMGEVWLCSGQSNMKHYVRDCVDGGHEVATANYPQIRLLEISCLHCPEPRDDIDLSLNQDSAPYESYPPEWKECSPESIPIFTGVGYFFGREIHKELDVPVGLINASWGGSACEAWMNTAFLREFEEFQPILDREQSAHVTSKPGHMFNAMIHPLIPFAIRGVIWYQGESNAPRSYQHRNLFPNLIYGWRDLWGQGDFPFYFVQLPNFESECTDPEEGDWQEMRESQLMTLATTRNTGMAVTLDLGDSNDIHPRNKQDVGKRLARVALAEIYGKDIVAYGPIFDSMTIEKHKVYLSFREIGDGLVTRDGGPPTGFAIAGKDRVFYWADAEIVDDKVVVSSPKVPEPLAVRYAWAKNPFFNLYNKNGLPASPFRTDTWPGVTLKNK